MPYKLILIASIVIPALIYGIFFNRMSETSMVQLSYVWAPALVFGAVGMKTGGKSVRTPALFALGTVAALFLFFELIFPSL